MRTRKLTSVVAAVLATALAGCGSEESIVAPPEGPSFDITTVDGEVILCKYTEAPTSQQFDFDVTADGGKVPGNGRFTISAQQDLDVGPECVSVWQATDDSEAHVRIEEDVPLGWELYTILTYDGGFVDPVDNGITVTASSTHGQVVFFKNRPGEIDMAYGRMTGGGGQISIGDVYVTRGFTIHCDITLSNNVEVNWEGNSWHIDKPLTSAVCIDDPTIEPAPPPAPFDTFIGEGYGRLNGVDGSFIRFTFVDSGEGGGKDDHSTIDIWAPGADPTTESPVLSVDGYLDNGNLQAHYDQPHGSKAPH